MDGFDENLEILLGIFQKDLDKILEKYQKGFEKISGR
jgi:hypothetical protein